jgi:polyisoprenoid-binding protein YceI
MTSTRILDGREVPVAGKWVFDHDHTVLGFVARHMVFTKVRGRFNEFDGAINIGERLEDSYVELDIDASSLTTEVADRDAHLKSSDFLEIAEHPKIMFRSTGLDLDAMTLTGDLTIRGVTHPVTLDFTYEGIVPYPWGGDRAMFRAQTEVAREDWNVSWNVALETGGWLVSKAVDLEIEAQAILVAEGSDEEE